MGPLATDRLTDGRQIVAVLRGRRQRAGSLVGLHVLARGDDRPARIAVVASKRVGGAVARNRAKRLMREAARRIEWSPGNEVVLVARAACARSTLEPVHAELAVLAERLDAVVSQR